MSRTLATLSAKSVALTTEPRIANIGNYHIATRKLTFVIAHYNLTHACDDETSAGPDLQNR